MQSSNDAAPSSRRIGAPLRVLLAKSEDRGRDEIRARLDEHQEFEIVCEASDHRDAIRGVLEIDLDVVLLDIALPEWSGVSAMRLIRARVPGSRVVAVTECGDGPGAARMLLAGAAGCIGTESSAQHFAESVRTVAAGGRYVTPGCRRSLASHYLSGVATPPRIDRSMLASAEREAFNRLAESRSRIDVSQLSAAEVDVVIQDFLNRIPAAPRAARGGTD